jgi:antitoxin ParD1/3/4
MVESTCQQGALEMPASITFTLPPSLRKWLDEQIEATGAGQEQFLRQLLRKEQRRQARQEIDDALEAGLKSGAPRPLTEGTWDRINRKADQIRRRKSG